MTRKQHPYGVLALALAIAACSGPEEVRDAGPATTPFDDLSMAGAGKADMVKNAHIIQDIDLNSEIEGTFRPRVRVHGFTFSAKAGAIIDVGLVTRAGGDSIDVAPGEPLDTVAAVYGPTQGDEKGRRVAFSDDTDAGLAAQLPEIEIPEDGQYLVVFSTWNDPGTAGQYDVSVACSGTNYQCRRPVVDRPCQTGTRYIQGQTVIGTETWSRCNVVLLESTEVEDGAILTVDPGVRVQGNFIGEGDYGDVVLNVNGTLQAVGSKEHPVVFTALREGWKGLELNGNNNTLRNVYVEKAAVGVRVSGADNTFEDMTVDNAREAFRFEDGSSENTLRRIRIEDAFSGITMTNALVTLEDSVILGLGGAGSHGLRADGGGPSVVRRSLISGFETGLYLNDTELAVYDTTIAENTTGVFVTGPDRGVHPAYTCPAPPSGTAPSRRAPSPPVTWPRDPYFEGCDLVNNDRHGLFVDAAQLVIVEESNIVGNGFGVEIKADSLNEESRIHASNVYGNGAEDNLTQVDAWHTNGVLDISGNYWAQISDPELSQSWRVQHSQTERCETVAVWSANGSLSGNGWSCTRGAYNSGRRQYRFTCTGARASATWTGEVSFTGFSPELLDAGPRLDELLPAVNEAREALELAVDEAEATDPVTEGRIVINELDYDQAGADRREFIELYNAGGAAVSLGGLVVELVNGWNGTIYGRYELEQAGSTLQAGEYLVIGDEDVLAEISDSVKRLALKGAIQNGSPDGVRLVTADGDFIDGLSYEGWLAGVGEGSTPSFRDSGSGLEQSLGRCGGTDTDDNAADFLPAVPTPGAPNAC